VAREVDLHRSEVDDGRRALLEALAAAQDRPDPGRQLA
jgi:hypothetical protein